MNHNSMLLASQSHPRLLSASNVSGSKPNFNLQNSTSMGNLNMHFNSLNGQVDSIRQTDLKLQDGIHEAREKLIKAIRPTSEVVVGSATRAPIYTQNIVNAGHLNQTIKRTENVTVVQQPVLSQRVARWQQPKVEAHRVGGVSVGPVRPNQVAFRQNATLRSRQKMLKVEEDTLELKRIIQQKTVRITQLQFELNQANIKIVQFQNSQRVSNLKCADCDHYKITIRDLEAKYNQLLEKLKVNSSYVVGLSRQPQQSSANSRIFSDSQSSANVSKMMEDLRSMALQRQSLQRKLVTVQSIKNQEIQRLTQYIEKLKLKKSEIVNQEKIYHTSDQAKFKTEAEEMKIQIQKLKLTIDEKNLKIRELQYSISSKGISQTSCSQCETTKQQFSKYKTSATQQIERMTQLNRDASRRQLRSSEVNELKSASQSLQFLNHKYANEIQAKEQQISDLNEQIMIFSHKNRASAERISTLESQMQDYEKKLGELGRAHGDKPRTTSYSESENQQKRLDRDLSAKIWSLQDENARLNSQLEQNRANLEGYRNNSEKLLIEVAKLNQDNQKLARNLMKYKHQMKDSQVSSSSDHGQLKGYHYNKRLKELEQLLEQKNYTVLITKINQSVEQKNIIIKQLSSKRRVDIQSKIILQLGGNCYALDEIIKRLIESLQHRERFIERINAQKDSLNSNLKKAEQHMRRSNASSKSNDKYQMLKISYEQKQRQVQQLNKQEWESKKQVQSWTKRYHELEQNYRNLQINYSDLQANFKKSESSYKKQLHEMKQKNQLQVDNIIKTQIEKVLTSYQANYDNLSKRLQVQVQQKDKIQRLNNNLQKEISLIKQNLDIKQRQIVERQQNLNTSNKTLQNQRLQLLKLNDQNKKQVQNQQEIVKSLNTRVKQLEKQINNIIAQHSRKQQVQIQNSKDIERRQHAIADSMKKIQQLGQKQQALRRQQDNLQQLRKKFEIESKSRQLTQKDKFADKQAELKMQEQLINQLSSKTKELEQLLNHSRTEKEQIKLQNNNKFKQIESREAAIAEAMKKANDLQQREMTLDQQNKNLQEFKRRTNTAFQRNQQEIAIQRENLQRLQVQIQAQKNKVSLRLVQLKKHQQQYQLFIRQKQEFQKLKFETRKVEQDSHLQRQKVLKKISDMEKQKQGMLSEIQKLKHTISTTKKQDKSLSLTLKQPSEVKVENQHKDAQNMKKIKQKDEQITDMKVQNMRMKSHIDSLVAEFERMKDQLSLDSQFAYEKIEREKQEKITYLREVQRLNLEVSKIERLEARNNSLTKQLQAKDAKISMFTKQLERTRIQSQKQKQKKKSKNTSIQQDRLKDTGSSEKITSLSNNQWELKYKTVYSDLQSSESKVRVLTQQLDHARSALHQKQNDFVNSTTIVQEQSVRNRQNIKILQSQFAKLRLQLEAEKRKSVSQTANYDILKSIQQMKAQLINVTKQRNDLYQSLANAETYIQKMQSSQASNKKPLTSDRQGKQQILSDELSNNQQMINALVEQLNGLREAMREIQGELEAERRKSAASASNSIQLDFIHQEDAIIQALKAQIQRLKGFQARCKVLEVQITKSRENISTNRPQSGQETSSVFQVNQSKIKDIENENTRLRSQILLLKQNQTSNLSSQSQSQVVNGNKLQGENSQLKSELQLLRRTLQTERSRINSETSNIASSVSRDKSQIQQLRKSFIELQAEKDGLYRNLTNAQNYIQTLHKKLNQVPNKKDQIIVDKSENQRLTVQIQILKQQVNQLREDIKLKNQANENQKVIINNTQAEKQQLQAQLTSSVSQNSELASLREQNNRLKKQIENASVAKSNQRNQNNKEQIQRLNNQIAILRQQTVVVSSQPATVSQAEADNSRLKLQIESLNKQLLQVRSRSNYNQSTIQQQEHIKLRKQIEDIIKQKDKLYLDLSNAQNYIQKVSKQLQATKKQINSNKAQYQQKGADVIHDNNDDLVRKYQQTKTIYQDKLATISKRMNQVQLENVRLRKELNQSWTQQIQGSSDTAYPDSDSIKQVEKLKRQIQIMKRQKNNIYENLVRAEKYIEKLQQKATAQTRIDSRQTINNTIYYGDRGVSRVEGVQVSSGSLQSENVRLRQELEAKENELRKTLTELSGLRSTSGVQVSSGSLQSENVRLRQQLDLSVSQLNQSTSQIKQLRSLLLSYQNSTKPISAPSTIPSIPSPALQQSSLTNNLNIIASLQQQISNLKSQLQMNSQNQQQSITKLRTSLQSSFYQNLAKAQNQIQRLITQNTTLQSMTTNMKMEIQKYQIIYEELEKSKIQQHSDLQKLIRKLIEQSKTDALQWERKKNQKISQLQQKHTKQVRQLQNTKNSFIESLNLKIQQLQSQLSLLKQQLTLKNKLQSEFKQSRDQIERLKHKIHQYEIKIQMHAKQEQRFAKLQQENKDILEQLRILNRELQRLNNELQRLNTELQQTSIMYESEKQKLSQELQINREKKDEIYENLVRAQAFIQRCEQQIEQLKLLLETESQKVKLLMSQQQGQDRSVQIQQQITINRRLKDELNSVIQKSETEKDQLLREIKLLKTQITQLDSTIVENQRRYQYKIEQLSRSKSQQLLNQQQETNMLKTKLKQTQQISKKLEKQNRQIVEQFKKSSTQQNSQLLKQLQYIKQQSLRKQGESSHLAQELEKAQRRIQDSAATTQSLESRLASVSLSYNKLLQQVASIKQQNSRLNTQVQSKSESQNQLRIEIARLQTEIQQQQDRLTVSTNMLKDNYQRVLGQLQVQRSNKQEVYRNLQLAQNYIQKCEEDIRQLRLLLDQQTQKVILLNQQRSSNDSASIQFQNYRAINQKINEENLRKIHELEQQRDSIIVENNQVKEQAQRLQKQVTVLMTQQQQSQQIKQSIQSHTHQLSSLQSINDRLNAEIDQVRNLERAAVEKSRKAEIQADNNSQIIRNLQLQLSRINRQLLDVKNTHTLALVQKTKSEDLNANLIKIQSEVKTFSQTNRNLQDEINRLDRDIQNKSNQLIAQQAAAQQAKVSLSKTQIELNNITNAHKQSQMLRAKTEVQLREAQNILSSASSKDATITELRNKTMQMQQESSQRAKAYELEILGLRNQIVELQQQIHNTSTSSVEATSFQNLLQNLTKAENHIQFIQSELGRLENENGMLIKTLNQRDDAILNLQNLLQESNAQKSDSQKIRIQIQLNLKHQSEAKAAIANKLAQAEGIFEQNLARREQQYNAISHELNELVIQLKNKNEELRIKDEQLQLRDSELKNKDYLLNRHATEIQNLQTSLEQQASLDQQTQNRAEEYYLAISEHQNKLTKANNQIFELKRQLSNKHLLESQVQDLKSNLGQIQGRKSQAELNLNKAAQQHKDTQIERDRLKRQVQNLNNKLARKDQIMGALQEIQKRNASLLSIIAEKDQKINKLDDDRRELREKINTSNAFKLENELKSTTQAVEWLKKENEVATSKLSKVEQQLACVSNLNNENQRKYESVRREYDQNRYKFNQAETQIKFLQLSIQDLNKNVARLRQSQRKCENLIIKIKQIEETLATLVPENLRNKTQNICRQFEGLIEHFNKVVQEQKQIIYRDFTQQFPEREEELKKIRSLSLIEVERSRERDASLIDQLNDKLINTERQKRNIFMELEKIKSNRDTEIKLNQSHNRIVQLEKLVQQLSAQPIMMNSDSRLSNISDRPIGPQHIQSMVISETQIPNVKQQLKQVREKVLAQEETIYFLQDTLKKRDEEIINLKQEKQKTLQHANKLITELEGIKKQFDQIQVQAQRKFKQQLDIIVSTNNTVVDQLKQKINSLEAELKKQKQRVYPVSPVKQFTFEKDDVNKVSQQSSPQIKSPLLSPRTKEAQNLRQKLATLENKLTLQQDQQKQSLEMIRKLQDSLDKVQTQAKESNKLKNDFQNQNKRLQIEVQRIQNALKHAESFINNREIEVAKMVQTISSLQKTQASSQEIFNNLNKEIEKLKNEIGLLEDQIAEKVIIIKGLNDKIQSMTVIQQSLENSLAEIKKIELEKSELQNNIKLLNNEIALQKQQLKNKTKQLQFIKTKYETEIHLLEQSFHDQEQKVHERDELISKKTEQLKKASAEYESLKAKNQSMVESKDLDAAVTQKSRLQNQLSLTKLKLNELQIRANTLIGENSNLATAMNILKEQNTQLRNSNQQLLTSSSHLKTQSQKAQALHSTIASLTSQNEKLTNDLLTATNAHSTEVNKLQQQKSKQLNAKEDQITFLKSEMDKVFKDNEAMNFEIERLHKEFAKMMEMIANLQDEGKKTQGDLIQQNQTLKKDNEALKSTNSQQTIVSQSLNAEINHLKDGMEFLRTEKQNIQKQLKKVQDNHSDLFKKYEQLSQAVERLAKGDQAVRGSSLSATPIKAYPNVDNSAKKIQPFEQSRKSPSSLKQQEAVEQESQLVMLDRIQKISRLLTASNDKIQQLLKVNDELANKVEDYESRSDSLIKKLEALQQDENEQKNKTMQEITEKSSQVQRKSELIESLNQQLITLRHEAGVMMDDNNKLANELRSKAERQLNLIQENQRIISNLHDIQQKLKNMTLQKQSEAAHANNQIASLQNIQRQNRQLVEQLTKQKSVLQQDSSNSQQKVSKLVDELRNLKLDQQRLVDQLQRSQGEQNKLINELQISKSDQVRTANELKILKVQYEKVQNELQSLKSDKNKMVDELQVSKGDQNRLIDQLQRSKNDQDSLIKKAVADASRINAQVANFRIGNQSNKQEQPQTNWLAALNQTIKDKLKYFSEQATQKDVIIQKFKVQNEKQSQQLGQTKQKLIQVKSVMQEKKDSQMVQQRYEQLLSDLLQYEQLNKKLTLQIQRLSDELGLYKAKVEQFSKHAIDSSNEQNNSSLENLELRKKLQDAEYKLLQIQQGTEIGEHGTGNQILYEYDKSERKSKLEQFLRDSLRKITFLQNNIDNLQLELNSNNSRLEQIIDNLSDDSLSVKMKQSSQLRAQLDQLQQQLMANEKEAVVSTENVDNVLRSIREVFNVEDGKFDKQRINKLLDNLEASVNASQKLHERQMLNMALTLQNEKTDRSISDEDEFHRVHQMPERERDESIGYHTERLAISGRVQLIKEIKQLKRMIDVYHREATRRQRKYNQVMNGLKADTASLKSVCGQIIGQSEGEVKPGSPQEKLLTKIKQINLKICSEAEKLKKKDKHDEEGSSGFDEMIGEQQIIARGQNADNQIIESARESLNASSNMQRQQNTVNIPSQANLDAKSFLEYVLNNNEFDREEILQLKKKVAELRSRQNRNNIKLLQQRNSEVQKLFAKNKQAIAEGVGINQYMETIAENLTEDQVRELLSGKNEELSNRVIELVNSIEVQEQAGSVFRPADSEYIAQQIRQIMEKYYPQSNKFSEALYQFILLMLSAPNDEVLLSVIDNIFSTIMDIEQVYINALQDKERMFKEHSQMMKRVLEKSSSDNSEDINNMMEENEEAARPQGRSFASEKRDKSEDNY